MKAVLVIAVVLAVAPFAAAATSISPVADALRSDPVYVDESAERALTDAQADELREAITDAGGDIYVAVLPASAGAPEAVLRELGEAVRRDGTYAVVVGNRFRASDNGELRDDVPALADAALRSRGEQGPHATLLDFVDRVGAAKDERAAPADDRNGDEGLPLLPIILIGGGGVAAYAWYRRRQRSAADERRQLQAVRELTEEDLVALADDVKELELDVSMPNAPAAARQHYDRALSLYERANGEFDQAMRPNDLERVTATVADGRWEMAAARAALERRPLPQRNPPCFFDPRHGPAARFVAWAPPGGAPRDVPACEADAQRVERGVEPDAREVTVDGERRPYWDTPVAAPWAMGFFGASLLPSLLVGSALGFGLGLGFPGGAFGGGYEGGDAGGGDFGDVGGGDFGDFGGGDFGDFGGGDFGGGDFGGGD